MLINGWKVLVVRCNCCGRWVENDFNLFKNISSKYKEFECECGNKTIIFEIEEDNEVKLNTKCYKCGERNIFKKSMTDLFKEDIKFNCKCGFEILYIGDNKNIKNPLFYYIDDLDKFNNVEVMESIFKKIRDMEKKGLVSCECKSSKIILHTFPDRVELKCENCNSVKIIYGETQEDLKVVNNKNRIFLKEKNISCIDSLADKDEIFENK